MEDQLLDSLLAWLFIGACVVGAIAGFVRELRRPK